MRLVPRRNILGGAVVALALAASGGVAEASARKIDRRVDSTLDFLFSNHPETTQLRDRAAGMLVMPLITKVGIGFGGSFGRGALRVGGATVDYYSAASASAGFQFGAKQYAHVVFFMTEEALQGFRSASGWAAGAGVEFVLNEDGHDFSANTTNLKPVIAVIFGQAGLHAGATIQGTKYTRIAP